MEEANIKLEEPICDHKTEPLQASTLTSADFDHISPMVMQDFLTEKIV